LGRKSDFRPNFAPVDLYGGAWYNNPPASLEPRGGGGDGLPSSLLFFLPWPNPMLLLLPLPQSSPSSLATARSFRWLTATSPSASCRAVCAQGHISLQMGGGLRSSSCCGSRSLPLLVHFTTSIPGLSTPKPSLTFSYYRPPWLKLKLLLPPLPQSFPSSLAIARSFWPRRSCVSWRRFGARGMVAKTRVNERSYRRSSRLR